MPQTTEGSLLLSLSPIFTLIVTTELTLHSYSTQRLDELKHKSPSFCVQQ